jgi:hypothetical protein
MLYFYRDNRYWSKALEYKKAVDILKNLSEKYPLTREEKDAVERAMGMMSWVSLSESRMKTRKAKREKSVDW